MRISAQDLSDPVPPGLGVPGRVKFSPDGRWIAWLYSPDRTRKRSLFLHEVEGAVTREITSPVPSVDESTLSQAEKLRRQRMRYLGQGVTTYSWSEQSKLVVPTTHSVWAYEPLTDSWETLLEVAEAVITDPQVSPDGLHLAWVQDGELMIRDLASGDVAALTGHVADGVTHGLADFLAQEEMDRMRGFWWSPSGHAIAYTEVDERAVPLFRIDHTSDDPYEFEEHRYPFAGGPNPTTRVYVVGLASRQKTQLDLGQPEYVTRVHWSGNESIITEAMDRSQSTAELIRNDIITGARTSLFTETTDHWINLHELFRSLPDGEFLWASERTGYLHLEVRKADGSLRTVLTHGEWLVHEVAAIDETAGIVWFTGSKQGVTQRNLFSVSLHGGDPCLITSEPGTHRVSIDPHHRYFIDLHDNVTTQPTLSLHRLVDGAVERVLFDDVDQRIQSLDLQPVELRAITVSDGETLYASVQIPKGSGPFPTLVHVYGGPNLDAPRVKDVFAMTAQLEFQYLRERGVCVVRVDNRGMQGRGTAFEAAVHYNLGHKEVQDQVDVIDVLANEDIVDRSRVVIKGASYGGYMSVMCLAQRPDVFTAAVGQAIVSSWDGYDTFYSERYMGLPSQNVAGYENSSLMHCAGGIKGNLLLIHGMLDDNTHFRHMTRLINSLIKHAVPYRLLVYPNERHRPVGPTESAHLRRQIMDFVLEQLDMSPESRGDLSLEV